MASCNQNHPNPSRKYDQYHHLGMLRANKTIHVLSKLHKSTQKKNLISKWSHKWFLAGTSIQRNSSTKSEKQQPFRVSIKATHLASIETKPSENQKERHQIFPQLVSLLSSHIERLAESWCIKYLRIELFALYELQTCKNGPKSTKSSKCGLHTCQNSISRNFNGKDLEFAFRGENGSKEVSREHVSCAYCAQCATSNMRSDTVVFRIIKKVMEKLRLSVSQLWSSCQMQGQICVEKLCFMHSWSSILSDSCPKPILSMRTNKDASSCETTDTCLKITLAVRDSAKMRCPLWRQTPSCQQ